MPHKLEFASLIFKLDGTIESDEVEDEVGPYQLTGTSKIPDHSPVALGARRLGEFTGVIAEFTDLEVEFSFEKKYSDPKHVDKTVYFTGKINVSRSSMIGTWGMSPEANKGTFFLKDVSIRQAKVTLFFEDLDPITSSITIDMATMEAYTKEVEALEKMISDETKIGQRKWSVAKRELM
jgi:ribosomal protein S18